MRYYGVGLFWSELGWGEVAVFEGNNFLVSIFVFATQQYKTDESCVGCGKKSTAVTVFFGNYFFLRDRVKKIE